MNTPSPNKIFISRRLELLPGERAIAQLSAARPFGFDGVAADGLAPLLP